ncbi:MAG: hypothetical protein ACC669_10360 [bacterium]
MVNLRNYIYHLRQAIFHRGQVANVENGISYEIGAGSYSPYPRPQMVYHWHPPLETLPFDRSEPDTGGLRNLIKRIGIWKKSA